MFIRWNIQILEQKWTVVKYDVNLNCAFMFVYFIQNGKIIKIYFKKWLYETFSGFS